MQRIYLDTGGFMALLSKEGFEILERELGEETIKSLRFCISPFTLEEFFYIILYRESEMEMVRKFCGRVSRNPRERAKSFFEKFGKDFARFLIEFENVGVEKEIIFLFARKDILETLTKDVKTYDLLHLFTAISNNLDGFLTNDKKFVRWVKENKHLLEETVKRDFQFFVINMKERTLEIYTFGELLKSSE